MLLLLIISVSMSFSTLYSKLPLVYYSNFQYFDSLSIVQPPISQQIFFSPPHTQISDKAYTYLLDLFSSILQYSDISGHPAQQYDRYLSQMLLFLLWSVCRYALAISPLLLSPACQRRVLSPTGIDSSSYIVQSIQEVF